MLIQLIIHPNGCTTKQPPHSTIQEGILTRTYVPPHDGTRYYDLSAHPLGEANLLAIELIAHSKLPCRMPDDTWLYPSR